MKQFSLEAALAVGIIGLAWSILDLGPSRGRWTLMLFVGVFATLASGAVAIVFGGVLTVVIAVSVGQRRSAWKGGLAVLAAYGLFAAFWWSLVLRTTINTSLSEYWTPFYIDGDSLRAYVGSLANSVLGAVKGLSFVPLWVVAPTLAAVVLIALRMRRWEVLVFTAPVGVAVVLAALGLAPLGTGRTDIYLYPGLALLAGAGVELVWRSGAKILRWAGPVGIVMLLFLAPQVEAYPSEDVRPLVAIADVHGAEEPVVIYPWAWRAYSLYTNHPVAFYKTDVNPEGFGTRVEDDQVRFFDFNLGVSELERLTSGADTVWFVASHLRSDWPDDYAVIEESFDSLGYSVGQRWDRPGAVLIQWERTR